MSKRIAWVVPGIGKGSGGHRTIFQNLNALVDAGYRCDIFVIGEPYKNSKEAQKRLKDYFGEVKASNVFVTFDHIPQYDLVFATGWQTVDDVKNICAPHKAYFIQDYEPWFMPVNYEYIKTERSYDLGWHHITIGRWLAHKVSRLGNRAKSFDFCADLNVYHPVKTIEKERAICCIYQPDKPRRLGQLVLESIKQIQQVDPELTIYTFGSDIKTNLGGTVIDLGLISIDELNILYNKCLLGLSISATNPSRIPFEMMASGLPVVELNLKNNKYDFPKKAVTLVNPDPRSISSQIISLLKDVKKIASMSKNGINYMKSRPLEYGYSQFIDAVNSILS